MLVSRFLHIQARVNPEKGAGLLLVPYLLGATTL